MPPFHSRKHLPSRGIGDRCIAHSEAILFAMAVAVHVPLEHMADPTDNKYIPRPEWYFLFLFQLLKYFEGDQILVGTVLINNPARAAALRARLRR